MSAAVVAHHAHIIDVISRDALATVMRARTEWRDWQPGDGTCYRVRVITVVGGPDYSDRILLVNCTGRTWAFQYATAPYRCEQARRCDRRADLSRGIPPSVWRAATPLLSAEGAL
jgi:hypothetical protein